MKTYSGRQVLVITGAAVFIVFLLMLGFGGIGRRNKHKNSDIQKVEQELDKDRFTLQDSPRVSMVDIAEGSGFTDSERKNISVYETMNPAVVNITTQVIGYNWFLEPVPSKGASGSGSIIDTRGYILTNNHVVENAYKVYLTLADGSQFQGEVIGSDAENDLAVIKFDPKGKELHTIPMGTSSGLRVGQNVLAIGNPYGLERTLTTGIISGLGRPLKNSAGLIMKDMIQTDASINPGNSGGPLLNTSGEMIGINTMIYSPNGGSVGIGFAVPVDTAHRVVADIIQYGKVIRGWLDIVPVQLFPSLVRYADLPVDKGLLVSRVIPGGEAAKAGLKGGSRQNAIRSGNHVIYLGGDIITAIDGEPVDSISTFYTALQETRPGDTVKLTVVRGKKTLELEVPLIERPENYIVE